MMLRLSRCLLSGGAGRSWKTPLNKSCPAKVFFFHYHGDYPHTLASLPLVSMSTLSSSSSTTTKATASAVKLDTIDLTFKDTEQAYKSKKTSELVRAILVLYISSFDVIINNHVAVSISLFYLYI